MTQTAFDKISVKEIFDFVNVAVTSFESLSYLTGVTTAISGIGRQLVRFFAIGILTFLTLNVIIFIQGNAPEIIRYDVAFILAKR